MTDTPLTLEALRAELREALTPIRAQLDGLPLINRALTILQQEVRAIRGGINDIARDQVTPGEIEALHADVNKVQAENAELAHRLATVERELRELREG